MKELLDQDLLAYRAQTDELVKALHELTLEIGHDELAQTVSDLRNRLNEPFMFVIVGEVKAGKSSFINAILATGREIAKVAPQPMTDTIQQLVYGEEERTIELNPFLKKIVLPVEILKEIAIVDTPGTNTIVEHHQEITERFIPAADLIVFVFEAKNPYRESAWRFFDYINQDWRKKIIFVLQQKDLMEPDDLVVNTKGVYDYAVKKGILEPQVFAVSAKQEQAGDPASGFDALRTYIADNITGGKAPLLKLQNNLTTSRTINRRIAAGLADRRLQYDADLRFRADIQQTLDEQEVKSRKQVDVLVENLTAAYGRVTREKEAELERELSFFTLLRRSFSSLFSKKESAKARLEGLAEGMEKDLNLELQRRLQDGVHDLADSIQQMAKLIDLKIRNSETILKNDHDLFSDIAERRANVLKDLQDAFHAFLNRTENFHDKQLFPADTDSLSPNLAAGSGIAVIGAILTAATSVSVLDITGGVLTAVGLTFAGISTSVKKRKILQRFREEVDTGHVQLNTELKDKLKAYVTHIRARIDANFKRFDDLLGNEQQRLTELEQRQVQIQTQIDAMAQRLAMTGRV